MSVILARDMADERNQVTPDDLGKRVVVVDTSNEIAGDGDIPHPGIGDARRMQVRTPTEQHAVMIEAVENHMPEVVVIDEIGTQAEALAARTIAERGVQLIATAHGNTLENLLQNPTLSDLIGGVQPVILSVGLSAPFNGYHWLRVDNIHFRDYFDDHPVFRFGR